MNDSGLHLNIFLHVILLLQRDVPIGAKPVSASIILHVYSDRHERTLWPRKSKKHFNYEKFLYWLRSEPYTLSMVLLNTNQRLYSYDYMGSYTIVCLCFESTPWWLHQRVRTVRAQRSSEITFRSIYKSVNSFSRYPVHRNGTFKKHNLGISASVLIFI